MSTEKKKYEAPKYEVVKFDSTILTTWTSPGCFGVVSLVFDMVGSSECTVTNVGGENIRTYNNEWYD